MFIHHFPQCRGPQDASKAKARARRKDAKNCRSGSKEAENKGERSVPGKVDQEGARVEGEEDPAEDRVQEAQGRGVQEVWNTQGLLQLISRSSPMSSVQITVLSFMFNFLVRYISIPY